MSVKARAIVVDYVDVFSSPAGKRVLEDMKRTAGVYDSKVVVGAPIETTRLIWNEAQRAFVLEVTNCAAYDFSKEPGNVKEQKNG